MYLKEEKYLKKNLTFEQIKKLYQKPKCAKNGKRPLQDFLVDFSLGKNKKVCNKTKPKVKKTYQELLKLYAKPKCAKTGKKSEGDFTVDYRKGIKKICNKSKGVRECIDKSKGKSGLTRCIEYKTIGQH